MGIDTESQPNKNGQEIYYAYIQVLLLPLAFYIYRNIWRISYTKDLPENSSGIRLYGVVTGISDGDGFRFFHCPLLRSRLYTSEDSRLYVRLAGIDAPEMGNSNMRRQPFARESKEYLKNLIKGENIIIKIVGVDQYNRVLAFAYLPRWFLKPILNSWFARNFPAWIQMDFLYINVNLEMVRNGYAWVYTGQDAMYDEYKETLLSLQKKSKRQKKGMWKLPNPESPMNYKRIHREKRS